MDKTLTNYLIAVDLDGTIVQGFDDYDKKSFAVLKQLSKTNKVVIATGRPYRSSKYFYNLLELTTPIINYNGALLHHPSDPSFPKEMIHIEKEELLEFMKANSDILVNVFCEIEDNIYLLNDSKDIEPYLHIDGGILYQGNFEEILPSNPNGAILFSKPGSEERLEKYVKEIYKDQVKIRHWFTNNLLVSELYNPLTSKANALKKICEYYNIPKNKTIAIGDGHNDIEMLEFAHYKVAMKNSHPDLFQYANYITDDVSESGVANFFLKHLKISDI